MTLRRWRRAHAKNSNGVRSWLRRRHQNCGFSMCLHKHAKDLAEHEGISMNQLITTALAEKVSAIETQSFLEDRARRGSRKRFESAMSKVADREPEDEERL
jgi:hypothetical protein